MMLFFSRFFALAALAIWAPIVIGLIGWLLWRPVPISTSKQGASSAAERKVRDPDGERAAREPFDLPSWEPGPDDPGFRPLDDAPLDA